MLVGEDLGGNHNRYLVVIKGGEVGGNDRHDRLTASHISHEESVHGPSAGHVMDHIFNGADLVGCHLKRKNFFQVIHQTRRDGINVARDSFAKPLSESDDQHNPKKTVENEPLMKGCFELGQKIRAVFL